MMETASDFNLATFLGAMLRDIAVAVLPIIGTYLARLIQHYIEVLRGQQQLALNRLAIEILDYAVENAVKTLMPQAEEQKKDSVNGKLTLEQVQKLQFDAHFLVLSQLSEELRECLQKIFGDFDQVIRQRIEAKLFDVKNAQISKVLMVPNAVESKLVSIASAVSSKEGVAENQALKGQSSSSQFYITVKQLYYYAPGVLPPNAHPIPSIDE